VKQLNLHKNMAHFALLDEKNIVVQVFHGRQEDDGKEVELSLRTGQTYKQTSYNTISGTYVDPVTRFPTQDQSKSFRKNFASIGFIYDPQRDAFMPPKPYPSWILDETTCQWKAPVAQPVDINENLYKWNEENLSWDRFI
jgi:hypothetical protein